MYCIDLEFMCLKIQYKQQYFVYKAVWDLSHPAQFTANYKAKHVANTGELDRETSDTLQILLVVSSGFPLLDEIIWTTVDFTTLFSFWQTVFNARASSSGLEEWIGMEQENNWYILLLATIWNYVCLFFLLWMKLELVNLFQFHSHCARVLWNLWVQPTVEPSTPSSFTYSIVPVNLCA